MTTGSVVGAGAAAARAARSRRRARPWRGAGPEVLRLVPPLAAATCLLGAAAGSAGRVQVPLVEVGVLLLAGVAAVPVARSFAGAGIATLAPAGLTAAVGLAIGAATARGAGAAAAAHQAVLWLALSVVALAVVAARDPAPVRRLQLGLLGAAGVAGAWAVAEFVAGPARALARGAIVAGRPEAGFGHPNALAAFLVLSLAAGSAAVGRVHGWARGLLVALCAEIVLAILLTSSREAWLAAVAALLTLAALRPRAWQLGAAAAAAGGLAALAAASDTVRGRVGSVVSPDRLDPDGFRVHVWGRALDAIADHPWAGVPRFAATFPFDGRPATATHAHDLFLGLGVAFGLPAALAFAALLGLAVHRALRSARMAARAEDRTAARHALAACVALLVVGVFDYPFWSESLTVCVVLVLALASRRRAPGRA